MEITRKNTDTIVCGLNEGRLTGNVFCVRDSFVRSNAFRLFDVLRRNADPERVRDELTRLRREIEDLKAGMADCQTPTEWTTMPAGAGRMLVTLDETNAEYERVTTRFHESLPRGDGFNIMSIERNQDSTR